MRGGVIAMSLFMRKTRKAMRNGSFCPARGLPIVRHGMYQDLLG